MGARLGLTAMAAALAVAAPAWAQNTQVPPIPIEQMTSMPVIVRAGANALGMVRGLPQFETMKALNRIQYTGTGTMGEIGPGGVVTTYKVTKYKAGLSYHLPAARIDFERVSADKKAPKGQAPERIIQVVNGRRAWNETTPGVGATPAPGTADERLRYIQITPHGFMSAVVRAAPQDLSFEKVDGKIVLTVKVNGVPITGTLNALNQPEKIVMPVKHPVLGDTTLEGIYSNYKDIDDYTVMFPTRFQQRLGGKPILDLAINGFATATYIVYPIPAGVQPDPS